MFKEYFLKIIDFMEGHSLVVTLSFFALGILITAWIPDVGQGISSGIKKIIDIYAYFVPFLLYFLLAPALIKIIDLAKEYGNGWLFRVIKQFVVARFLAIFFAIMTLSIIFELPIHLDGGLTFVAALEQTIGQLIHALFFSPFLYGVYAAGITFFFARRFTAVKEFFHRVGAGIEVVGGYLQILSPLFMFAIGSFLYHLSIFLQENLTQDFSSVNLNLGFLGLSLLPERLVFVWLYLIIGLTTGVLCLLWHGFYILYTKIACPHFSFKYYFKNYWLKVYPLLWSSSSETLGVPLSLNLMKNNFPEVPASIRQFVIAGGSYLGINGTLISVYVMGVFLAVVLGVEISFLQLLFSLPVIFILGYAVPGIPGELVIFAGTMGILLGVPSNILPLFLALYLTLQIGLPDSFRTGCNSTDSALVAISSIRKLNIDHTPRS